MNSYYYYLVVPFEFARTGSQNNPFLCIYFWERTTPIGPLIIRLMLVQGFLLMKVACSWNLLGYPFLGET